MHLTLSQMELRPSENKDAYEHAHILCLFNLFDTNVALLLASFAYSQPWQQLAVSSTFTVIVQSTDIYCIYRERYLYILSIR